MNRSELIKQKERLNKRFENKYFPLVQEAIKSEISSLIGIVKRDGIQSGINAVHTKIHSGSIPNIINDLYREVGVRWAKDTWRDLQEQKRKAKSYHLTLQTKGFGFIDTWVAFIKDYLYRFLIDKITFRVSETTRDVLLNTLYTATENGWGVDETVRALEELPLSATQAARIVRTEVMRAANTGAMAAGETFEFEQTKEWMAAQDSRTRGRHIEDHADHYHLDGITIDYDELFIDPRNGAGLRFPGDPEAPAENTINCRCTVAVVAKIGSNGRLIPKKR